MGSEQPSPAGRKRCFVVMGFGVKTDYATGRKLDLDKLYRLLIKPVVQQKGLECFRADEIRHSGTVDVPMYQELLTADVVIADVSTSNSNALYELGIRHALRPRTTIVISENKLPYPFDLNHISITSYTHLGDAIDFDEVERFRGVLGATLDSVLEGQATDSPIYTVLQQLTPPRLGAQRVARAREARERRGKITASAAREPNGAPDSQDKTLATFIEEGESAIQDGRFDVAKAVFSRALQLCRRGLDLEPLKRDPYLVQRLVLATYKAKQPDELSALNEAMSYLAALGLEESNDPGTVGLAGAIEKRLFENGRGGEHLERAIRYYARGYFLRNDRYNGINLAYLLTVRTDTPLDRSKEEKIADLVWANRIRREVLVLCEKELNSIRTRETRTGAMPESMEADQRARDKEQKFWFLATKAEAHFGLGEREAYDKARFEARALGLADWMTDTMDEQIGRLKVLLEKHGHLLGSP